jgi:4-amino-4-deoxy-L-arabinose transferase-like glycosyltransferase
MWLLLVLLAAGIAVRLTLAAFTFLNPDEALHYFIAAQPTFSQTYIASLTTAHPPLMFLLLHGWMRLGHSELVLRLPFVLAGVLFCAFLFLWVGRIAGQKPAFYALVLCLFFPSLISLSAEIRQYPLMLMFCAASLYWLECGMQTTEPLYIALSDLALWMALLTHYSALIFAGSVGIYALLRLGAMRRSVGVLLTWIFGQLGGLAICWGLFVTQISKLRQAGVPAEISATWLRTSIFHPGQDHFFSFVGNRTVRLFRYFCSHGTIGVLMLALFCVGLLLIFRGRQAERERVGYPLGVLLVLPFVLTIAAAVAGAYPYGGTRHDVVLILFAVPAIAIGFDAVAEFILPPIWLRFSVLVILLLVCNAFPAPTGPYIRPRNQRRDLMAQAVTILRSQPSGTTVLTDYQGGLALSYYLCGKTTALPFGPAPVALLSSPCMNDTLLTRIGSQGNFDLGQLPAIVAEARQTTAALWIFQTGWIDDEQSRWMEEMHQLGCGSVHTLGANIRLCEVKSAPQR